MWQPLAIARAQQVVIELRRLRPLLAEFFFQTTQVAGAPGADQALQVAVHLRDIVDRVGQEPALLAQRARIEDAELVDHAFEAVDAFSIGARPLGDLHVDAELRIETALHQRELREHHGRGPRLEPIDRGFGQIQRACETRQRCVALRTDDVRQGLRGRQRAARSDVVHALERIQVIQVHFHDDDVGGAIRALELWRELRVFPGQRVHRAGEIDGVVLALHRPDGGAVGVRGRRQECGQQQSREAAQQASRHPPGENHAADSAAVRKCTPVSMAPLECSVSSR